MRAQKGRQDIHVKLNSGLPYQKRIHQDGDCLHRQIELKSMEETSYVLHLEYSFIWSVT